MRQTKQLQQTTLLLQEIERRNVKSTPTLLLNKTRLAQGNAEILSAHLCYSKQLEISVVCLCALNYLTCWKFVAHWLSTSGVNQ